MSKYKINYIDGNDLKFKTFTTHASSYSEAKDKLWESYPNGDFDHQIVEVIMLTGKEQLNAFCNNVSDWEWDTLGKYQLSREEGKVIVTEIRNLQAENRELKMRFEANKVLESYGK